jgi:hypothetical protein
VLSGDPGTLEQCAERLAARERVVPLAPDRAPRRRAQYGGDDRRFVGEWRGEREGDSAEDE